MTGIRRVDGSGFEPYADESLEVYRLAMGRSLADIRPRRDIVARHATYPGFRSLLAVDADALVGFGYGFPGAPGQWWHDVVAGALEPAVSAEWMPTTFEVAELHVLPDRQGQGLGHRLLTDLLSDAPGRTAVLSTADADTRARRLYRSLGFLDLRTGFCFPGMTEPYCMMGSRLPLATG